MSRSKVVLVTLLVLLLAYAIIFGGDRYRGHVYIQHVFPNTTFTFYTKKVSWLPGPLSYAPTQQCPFCQQGHHSECVEVRPHFRDGHHTLDSILERQRAGESHIIIPPTYFKAKQMPGAKIPTFACRCSCVRPSANAPSLTTPR